MVWFAQKLSSSSLLLMMMVDVGTDGSGAAMMVDVGTDGSGAAAKVDSAPEGDPYFSAQFFGLDTNGVQNSVRRMRPELQDGLHR